MRPECVLSSLSHSCTNFLCRAAWKDSRKGSAHWQETLDSSVVEQQTYNLSVVGSTPTPFGLLNQTSKTTRPFSVCTTPRSRATATRPCESTPSLPPNGFPGIPTRDGDRSAPAIEAVTEEGAGPTSLSCQLLILISYPYPPTAPADKEIDKR